MTWGCSGRSILLPAEADSGARPPPRRSAARAGTRPAVRLPDAGDRPGGLRLYWFHPLAWLLSVGCGSNASAPATTSCCWPAPGERLRRPPAGNRPRAARPRAAALAALAMARPSQLEGRLVAILDPDRRRRGPGRNAAAIALLAALFMLFPLAMLRSARGGRQPWQEPIAGKSPAADPSAADDGHRPRARPGRQAGARCGRDGRRAVEAVRSADARPAAPPDDRPSGALRRDRGDSTSSCRAPRRRGTICCSSPRWRRDTA